MKRSTVPADTRARASGLPSLRRRLLTALGVAPLGLMPVTKSVLASKERETVIRLTGADGKALPNTVVALTALGKPPASVVDAVVEVAQQRNQFTPRIKVVQTGTRISFPNLDQVRHHVYSFSKAKMFELRLYGKELPEPVLLDKPGTVVLGCNIHDRMVGFIRVVDTPHHGLTDNDGKLIMQVPPGKYRVALWHPDLDLETAHQMGDVEIDEAVQILQYSLAVIEPPLITNTDPYAY